MTSRARFEATVDALRARAKAHTSEGDAIAAARRRLPMVEVDAEARLIGPRGALTLREAFEGRRQLIAYYFMWNPEAMDNSYALMDLTVHGRQESWEDSPDGWPQSCTNVRTDSGAPSWTPVIEWPRGTPDRPVATRRGRAQRPAPRLSLDFKRLRSVLLGA